MRKAILFSVALVPLLLALHAAADSRPRRGLRRLVVKLALFDFIYGALLFYVYLRLSD